MKRKGLVGFLIGIFICMVMALPSFVCADWTITGTETNMIDLEGDNPTVGRLATVTGTGSVVTGDDAALWASVNGWSVNVENGAMVRATSSGYYGVLFNSESDGYGTFLNGTVTNYGTIGAINGTGIALGSGSITNSGSIIGYNTAIDFSGTGTGTATVTNNAGGLIFSHDDDSIYIYSVGTATVTNSGTIQSRRGDAIYIEDVVGTAAVTNVGGFIQSHWGNGLDIYNVGTATVINSGTIQSDDNSNYYAGLYIGSAGTATVTNSGTIQAYGSGLYIEDTGTATVTNNAGGLIQSYYYAGIYINNVGTVTVTNSGTITTTYDVIGIYNVDTATVTNNAGGLIQSTSDGSGIDISGVGTATVINSGTINSSGPADVAGIYIQNVGTATVTNNAGGMISADVAGIYISGTDNATVSNSGSIEGGSYGAYITGPGNATVTNYAAGNILGTNVGGLYITTSGNYSTNITNYGTIASVNGNGIYIWGDGGTATHMVTNSGTISGGNYGLGMEGFGTMTVTNNAGGVIASTGSNGTGLYISAEDSATVYNHGTIEGTGTNSTGVRLSGSGANTLINYAGGLITSGTGIFVTSDNATIENSGTITGTDGSAIILSGNDIQVILGTGTVINGNIQASGYGSNNSITLDGHGTLGASQIRYFDSLNKTGAGIWKLTGDATSSEYSQTNMLVTEGVLAFGSRDTLAGVTTNHFEQLSGASLGFVVNAMTYAPGEMAVTADTGLTGALTVTSMATAVFNNGTIVVIPTAGKYAPQTTYLSVLDLSATSIDSGWSQVTSTSAFFSPSLVETGGGTQVYDLILNRLSFSTGALNSSLSLGYALDGMYDDATGDMRTILDELITLSPGDAQTALAELGGGTHMALQFMSFYGLSKYHWALNNHLGGGWFAGGSGKGMAWNQNGYPQSFQMAMAGGGNTMSDTAPILLALAGNGGQLASGTKWDLWIDGYYSQGNRRSDDLISKYKQTLYGALMGFDFRATDNLLIGVSAGLSQAEVKFDDLLDKGRMDSYQGSLYSYYDGKPWYVEGVLTYAYNAYKMDRWISIGGITRLANADYHGNEYAGYAEVGYKLDVGGILEIRPMAAFQAAYLMQNGYTETGADDLNLVVDSRNTGSYQSYLGLHMSKAIALGKFVLTPEARVKWAHEFSPDDHLINARFSGDGSGSFTVEADRPSRDTAIVGLGLNGRFNKNLSVYIQYDAELNRDYTNHTGMMGLRLSW